MREIIATPKRTKEITEKYNFAFKKSFGQNFLIDANILRSIISAAGITKDDNALEIGPGIGSLTQFLAENAKNVVAVEIDKNLIPVLKYSLSEYDNIKLISADILKLDFSEILDNGSFKIVANLPYNIAANVVMRLLEQDLNIKSMTVMVQKEVAERMTANPSDESYGALSLLVKYYSNAKINFLVPPGCFMPKPKVDSAVITLDKENHTPPDVKDKELLFHVIKCAFGQRRKTLINSLFNQSDFNLSKDDLKEILLYLSHDPRVRGEALNLDEFIKLTDCIYDKIKP